MISNDHTQDEEESVSAGIPEIRSNSEILLDIEEQLRKLIANNRRYDDKFHALTSTLDEIVVKISDHTPTQIAASQRTKLLLSKVLHKIRNQSKDVQDIKANFSMLSKIKDIISWVMKLW